MALTMSKSSRPSFSPSPLGKSKITKSRSEKVANANSKDKTAVRRKSNGEIKVGESSTSRVQKSKSRAKTTHNGTGKDKGASKRNGGKRQRGAGGTMRAFLDQDASVTEEDEDEDAPRRRARKPTESDESGVLNEYAARMDTDESDAFEHRHEHKQSRNRSHDSSEDEEEEEVENDAEEEPAPLDEQLDFSSPEPDFILAEVTYPAHQKSSNPPGYAIPLPLLHRIMHASFTSPSRTTLSADARSLMGKYMEIFVKEAVRRCVDEKKERVQQGGEGDVGWLEVEDLERVGSQLVLDF